MSDLMVGIIMISGFLIQLFIAKSLGTPDERSKNILMSIQSKATNIYFIYMVFLTFLAPVNNLEQIRWLMIVGMLIFIITGTIYSIFVFLKEKEMLIKKFKKS